MDRELEVATRAAKRAGAAIMDVYRREKLDVVQKAGDKGPLTEADLRSNDILIDELKSAFPADALLSEELADSPERLAHERVWIIDPLDGTREFTLGIPEFCVSIGLSVGRNAVLGVLYNPVLDQLVAGVVGAGCTLNGAPVRVSSKAEVAGARLLVSRSEMEKGWFDAWKDSARLEPMGSVAWKFGVVAAGQAEATFTPITRNEWDLCGGVACVLAAGGKASTKVGAPYQFNDPNPLMNGVCGTNGALHPAILAMMEGR